MTEAWLWLDTGSGDPAFNMALDQVLLESAPLTGQPVLRFYGWTRPAASFGYFQRYEMVARATASRPLIRRPTGGGIVPHDADWTYSVTIPTSHEWYDLKAEASYRRMHAWIRDAFKHLGIQTTLAREAKSSRLGECFVGHEIHDLLWEGRKIAGAAQRRTRNGLLIQGSVQPPPLRLGRSQWQEAMRTVAHHQWTFRSLDAAMLKCASALSARKYATEDYNRIR